MIGISLNGMENVATAKDAVDRLNALLEGGPKAVEGVDGANTHAVSVSSNPGGAGKVAETRGGATAPRPMHAAAALGPGVTEKYRMWEEAVTLLYQVRSQIGMYVSAAEFCCSAGLRISCSNSSDAEFFPSQDGVCRPKISITQGQVEMCLTEVSA